MRFIMITLLICTASAVLGQSNVSSGDDTRLRNAMRTVENSNQKATYKIDFEPQNETAKAMVETVITYYRSIEEEDFNTNYEMMCQSYKDGMSLLNHIKKDRIKPLDVKVSGVKLDGECGEVLGTMRADTRKAMGVIDLPIRLIVFKESDQWRVYANPYEVMGFTGPLGRKLKPPCSFRTKPERKKKDKSPQ